MQLSVEQMAALSSGYQNRFEARLSEFVKARCDVDFAFDRSLVPRDPHAFAAKFRTLLTEAAACGIRSRMAIAKFVIIGFSYSSDFYRIPAARGILLDPTLQDIDKVNILFSRIILAALRVDEHRRT